MTMSSSRTCTVRCSTQRRRSGLTKPRVPVSRWPGPRALSLPLLALRTELTSSSAYRRLNSDITIDAHPLAFAPSLFSSSTTAPSSTPARVLQGAFDLVIDCTDNPATRHFLSAYTVAHRIPLVSGGAVRTDGTVGVYGIPLAQAQQPSQPSTAASTSAAAEVAVEKATEAPSAEKEEEYGPCYACLFPPAPASGTLSDEQAALQGTGACADEGVLGALCGAVGVTMASEALKVLLGTGSSPLSHPLW